MRKRRTFEDSRLAVLELKHRFPHFGAPWRPSPDTAVDRPDASMSLTPSRKPPPGQRRRSGGSSGRHAHSDTSSTHAYLGPVRTPEDSPVARTYPSTPRRQAKHSACSDNHGVRVPPPEQYLTPLQQKEVCIRHLRARLRDNVERLQHRDYEIDELRNQLCRMQEDWIEEECHRVEAQLALKEARREIHHLQEVVETVRTNLNVREDPHEHKPCPGGLQRSQAGGRSRSCGCSPASTLTRGSASSRLSSESLQLERSVSAAEAGRAPRAGGQTHLLLEAALVSGPPAAVPRSSTYERMCSGGAVLPVSHSCQTLSSSCTCSGHAFLPHHHLFLHLPQEEAPATLATAPAPAPEPIPPKPQVRSQACSPTMTWLEDEVEDLSLISDVPAPEIRPMASPGVQLSAPEPVQTSEPPPRAPEGLTSCQREVPAREEAQTCQPHPAAAEPEDAGTDGLDEDERPPQVSHWSRYFLVDLLALAMPVVPTVAWLCRGAPQGAMPVYHIGSLLRGCCAVALHSLRRRGAAGGGHAAYVNKHTQM